MEVKSMLTALRVRDTPDFQDETIGGQEHEEGAVSVNHLVDFELICFIQYNIHFFEIRF